MKLTNEELKKIYFGALFFEESEDGYLQAFQYTKHQMEYFRNAFDFWYERCTASTSKTLEFETEGTEFSLDYKIVWTGSQDSFEVEVDGLLTKVFYVKELPAEGTISFTLPAGKKQVVVYLPADATAWIRNFTTDKPVTPRKKGPKVLWLGDSITQGFGPLRSALTYVCVANRLLNYDILNQGIGGYVYDKNAIEEMPGYKPEKIIVSFGTNQYHDDIIAVEDYYKALKAVYKDTPVLCITPIWRGDAEDAGELLTAFCEKIKAIAGKYPNVQVVEGYKLVPHLSEYYLDNLHPNGLGAEIYGRNLVRAIEKLGF